MNVERSDFFRFELFVLVEISVVAAVRPKRISILECVHLLAPNLDNVTMNWRTEELSRGILGVHYSFEF